MHSWFERHFVVVRVAVRNLLLGWRGTGLSVSHTLLRRQGEREGIAAGRKRQAEQSSRGTGLDVQRRDSHVC